MFKFIFDAPEFIETFTKELAESILKLDSGSIKLIVIAVQMIKKIVSMKYKNDFILFFKRVFSISAEKFYRKGSGKNQKCLSFLRRQESMCLCYLELLVSSQK